MPAVAPAVVPAAPISSPAIPVVATPVAALQAGVVPAVALTPAAPPIPSPALDKAPVDPVMATVQVKALVKA